MYRRRAALYTALGQSSVLLMLFLLLFAVYSSGCVFIFCFLLEPPAAPRNLHVTDVTTSSVTLGWEPPETSGPYDVTQYNIDMKDDQLAEYSYVAKVSSRITSYTVEDLHRGRLYRFRVRSKNAAGYSEPAAELDEPVQLKALGIPRICRSEIIRHTLAI